MNQDEIIRMAHKAGSHEYGPLTRNWSFELSQLERFAAVVAEATSDIKYEKGYKDGYEAALRNNFRSEK